MPELPEVETVVRSLKPLLVGRRITAVELPSVGGNGAGTAVLRRLLSGRAAAFQKKLRGVQVREIRRYGKNILIRLRTDGKRSPEVCLLVHLGMTGRLTFEPTPEPRRPHTHVIFSLDAPGYWLHYSDPRRFGKLHLIKESVGGLEALGPDPLEISAEAFYARVHARRAMLKSLLLNQRFLRGLGNIYADESLSRARLHPAAIGAALKRPQADRLHESIQETLAQAIALGGSSISSYVDAQGRSGWFQQAHQVYGRAGEKCFRCGARIRRMIIASRSTHFCPRCQRAGRRQSLLTKLAKRSQ